MKPSLVKVEEITLTKIAERIETARASIEHMNAGVEKRKKVMR